MKFIANITRQYEMSHPQIALLQRVSEGDVCSGYDSKTVQALINHELIKRGGADGLMYPTQWGRAVLDQNGERKKMQKSLNELISLTKKLNSRKI